MFLSRMFSATPVLGGLVVAAAALLPAGQASAQAPNNIVSKFDRANAGVALPGAYWYAPQGIAPQGIAPHVYYAATMLQQPASGPLMVTVTTPRQSAPLLVNVRGVDGVVRAYPVEGGFAGIETRQVIVRQGESASFRFVTAAVPPK